MHLAGGDAAGSALTRPGDEPELLPPEPGETSEGRSSVGRAGAAPVPTNALAISDGEGPLPAATQADEEEDEDLRAFSVLSKALDALQILWNHPQDRRVEAWRLEELNSELHQTWTQMHAGVLSINHLRSERDRLAESIYGLHDNLDEQMKQLSIERGLRLTAETEAADLAAELAKC